LFSLKQLEFFPSFLELEIV